MLTSFFRNPRQGARRASLRRISQNAVLAGLLLIAPGTIAGVGLPIYDGPLPQHPQTSLEDYAVTRQISAQADLSCNTRNPEARASLDFAPPSDFRPASNVPAQLPLIVQGNQAVLYAGKMRHTTSARLHEGRLLFISADDSFFDSLQGIQPGDQLLIHTAQTLRQYRITSARLSHTVAEGDAGESLSLVACYPFQPVTSQPIFYELRAKALLSEPTETAQHDGHDGRLINF